MNLSYLQGPLSPDDLTFIKKLTEEDQVRKKHRQLMPYLEQQIEDKLRELENNAQQFLHSSMK